MELAESLAVRERYDRLVKQVEERTREVFRDLTGLYRRMLKDTGSAVPEQIEVPEQDSETRFDFKIRGAAFVLVLNEEPALAKELREIADSPDVLSMPLKHVVERAELKQHFAGCITLVMRFEDQYGTLMRMFVNADKEIAFEYTIGWKQPFLFRSYDDFPGKEEAFFTEPLTQSLLGVPPLWKTLEEVEIVDDIRDLLANDIRIGFIQEPETTF